MAEYLAKDGKKIVVDHLPTGQEKYKVLNPDNTIYRDNINVSDVVALM